MTAFSNMYPNLPGMFVSFKDGGLTLREDSTTDDTTTNSMLILGTAVDGIVMEPVAVDDSTAEQLFGSAVDANGISNGSTLIKAYKQARKRGCTDIRLMRISGSSASTKVAGDPIVTSSTDNVEDKIGTVNGNASTTLQLAHTPVVKNSVKVKVGADNTLLLSGYTVTEADGKVFINANICKAGEPVSIEYDYTTSTPVSAEKHTVDSSLQITLDHDPKAGTIVVKDSTGTSTIASSDYTVDGKVITFAGSVTGAGDSDEVQVDYEYDAVSTATENSNGGTPFKTDSAKVTAALSKKPSGAISVYANGSLVSSGLYSFDTTKNEITFDTKDFEMGDKISVKYDITLTDSTAVEIKIESYFGGAVYNQGSVEVKELTDDKGNVIVGANGVNEKVFVITKPSSKLSSSLERPIEYSTVDYPSMSLLIDAVNSDEHNGVYKMTTETLDLASNLINVTPVTKFVGGDDGVNLTKQELFEKLSGKRDSKNYLTELGAYNILEDYKVDYIVPTGVYADDVLSDKKENFAYELALVCAALSYRNKTTLGVIAMSPNTDTTLLGVKKYANKCANFNNNFFMIDNDGELIKIDNEYIDIGRYISIVAGPETVNRDNSIGTFYGNPAVDYAALNTVLLPQSAPTNKTIANIQSLKFNFSAAQLDSITGNRIVTFKSKSDKKNNKTYVVTDGVTCAMPNSDYARITTFKVLQYVIDDIREVADPYIGEPNTVEQRNALSAAISKRLTIHKEKGIIQASSFQIIATAQNVLIGEAQLELTIVPPQELRRITTVVGLSAEL